MDIAELSRKMEETPLDPTAEPANNESFSPRFTRSQAQKRDKCLKNDPVEDTHPKRNHRKVNEVEKIYLNKKPKVVHKNLETIYEDPIWKRGNTLLLGTAKVKRSLYLDREFRITTKQKSKLRKMKIKRLGKRLKCFKMTDEEFKNKMLRIDNYLNENEIECDVELDNCDSQIVDGNVEVSMEEESANEFLME